MNRNRLKSRGFESDKEARVRRIRYYSISRYFKCGRMNPKKTNNEDGN